MRYRFIGKDGSMGYRHGKVYFGSMSFTTYLVFEPFNVFRNIVPYSSEEKFFENWEVA